MKPPPSTGGAALRSLQIGRGLAALFVVTFHLNNSVWGVAKYFPHEFCRLLIAGKAGVQFFFVLSGFIIYFVHARDIGQPSRVGAFLRKRFVRVYPTYWVVLALVLAAIFLNPVYLTADARDFAHVIASILLVPYPVDPVLSVAWTLEHEVMFYALFAICILYAPLGRWVFVAWQLACLGNTLFGPPEFPYGVIFAANNLLFGFGAAAAYLYRRGPIPAPGTMALAGATAFLATASHEAYAAVHWPADAYVLSYGAASAVAILGACNFERRHGLRWPRLFDMLGDASYSIYLVHLPLLSLFAKLLFAVGLAALLPQTVSFALLLCVVAASGILFSRTVETPLIAALRK